MKEKSSPIFVIGNPRSGTTLLRLMLTCHPNITIPPEGGFIIQLFDKYKNYNGQLSVIKEFAEDVNNCRKVEQWNMPVEKLEEFLKSIKPENYSELCSGVYYFYSKINGKKAQRWGDKNNYYLDYLSSLLNIFPSAKFIHIIRDGRDVACSYKELSTIKGKYAPKLSSDISEIATQWTRNVQKVISDFRKIDINNKYVVRYEDLVKSPETELKKLCDFLDEDYTTEMLSFYEKNREKQLEPAVYDRWKQKNKEKVNTSRVCRWKKELSEEEKKLFESIAGNLLNKFDY